MIEPSSSLSGNKPKSLVTTLFVVLCLCCLSQTLQAQTSTFTYQGKLNDAGALANGPYDFLFKLFNLPTGGSQIGDDVTVDDAPVAAGIFTVTLDFGSSPFTTNSGNFLEIAVRPGASTGAYTTLTPRQPLTASPYSVQTIRATSAAVADNSLQLGGVAASQYVQTNDSRLSDSRNPLPNSSNYVQNTTTTQAANFNISGTGTAGAFDAAFEYRIGGVTTLRSSFANSNVLVGFTGGGGTRNTFVGSTIGGVNTGTDNSFFGNAAGTQNTSGSANSFFGSQAGQNNSTATENSFFGFEAGVSNQTGCCNSFFGRSAGQQSTSGQLNTFIGNSAGFGNTGGSNNTFIGASAGDTNVGGINNTVVGNNADVGFNNLANATAIGWRALVTTSNSLVLGSINGINGANASTNVGIGTTGPGFKLHVIDSSNTGLRVQTNTAGGTVASFGGSGAFQVDANGVAGGRLNIAENGNVGIGTPSPNAKLQVGGGSIYITHPNSLIITSPNGGCWFITVNDTGGLSTFSVTCP